MIIKSSKTFQGGEFKTTGTRYIKPGIRTMNFYDKNMVDGAYVYILGAYKEDGSGNGVWYRPLKIRDNFGMDTKEKFAVPANCPVDYFANKVKTHAPQMARVEKIKGEDGRDRNVYPAFGRTTWRVLYNAAFFNDTAAGVHVLDLPQSGGASALDEFVKGKGPDGEDNPDITDYTAAYPVYVKLDLKSKGQPWKITVNNAKPYPLPVELADTEYLFNLDDVIMYPNKQDLVEKLRTMFPADIFNKCIAGYSDGSAITISSEVKAVEDDLDYSPPQAAPKRAISMPTANIPKAVIPKPAGISPIFPELKAPTPHVQETEEDDSDAPQPPVTSSSALDMAKKLMRNRPPS